VRSKSQVLIGCWCEAGLVEKIDNARRSISRSQFCREAIAEKLRGLGFHVPETEIVSPNRAGKGGPRVTYRLQQYQAALNEGTPAASPTGKRPARKNSPSNP
jgi:hypothetical protein